MRVFGILQRRIDLKWCTVGADDPNSPSNSDVNCKYDTEADHKQFNFWWYFTDKLLGIRRSEIREYSVQRDRSVECKEGIDRVHEPFFLVRLERENGKPNVKWRGEYNVPEWALSCTGTAL